MSNYINCENSFKKLINYIIALSCKIKTVKIEVKNLFNILINIKYISIIVNL